MPFTKIHLIMLKQKKKIRIDDDKSCKIKMLKTTYFPISSNLSTKKKIIIILIIFTIFALFNSESVYCMDNIANNVEISPDAARIHQCLDIIKQKLRNQGKEHTLTACFRVYSEMYLEHQFREITQYLFWKDAIRSNNAEIGTILDILKTKNTTFVDNDVIGPPNLTLFQEGLLYSAAFGLGIALGVVYLFYQ